MRIGQLEKETSIPVETLRFWERQGLLKPSRKGSGKYRHYGDKDIKRVKFILNAKSVGFTLSEILKLLEMDEDVGENTHNEALEFAENKLISIDAKIAELSTMRKNLAIIIDDCKGGNITTSSLTVLQALDDDIG